jgi:phosphate transport system protein
MTCLIKSVEKITTLANKALKMFNHSIEAFLNKKSTERAKWIELDDEIDSLHKELIDSITNEMLCNQEATRAGVSLILSARYIERIADHACNISEETIYVVTSKREPID